MNRHKSAISLAILILLLPQVAHALEVSYPPVIGAETPQVFTKTHPKENWFALYLQYSYHLLINLTGLVCLYALLSGGIGYLVYNWMGNPGAAAGALVKISLGLTGAGLTLGSYLMLNTLNPQILKFHKELTPIDIEIADIGDPGETFKQYAEIPMGKLIEQVLDRSKPVRDQAVVVNNVGQQVKDQALCVQSLTDQCLCGVLEMKGCKCIDPGNCPECSVASCEGDPCNLTGTLCSGGSGNIREALEIARAVLSSLTGNLVIEKEVLSALNNNLERANRNLKIAETLVRDSNKVSGLHNYMTFVEVKQAHAQANETVQITELWPFERDVPGGETIYGTAPLRFECSAQCSADTTSSVIPCCMQCGNVLVCHGNDFKCDSSNTDERRLCDSGCSSDEIFPASDPETFESGGWSATHFKDILLYNGTTFHVPSGGVRYCDLNQEGCFNTKCEEI